MNDVQTDYVDEVPLDTMRAVVPGATPLRWTLPNASPSGGTLALAGWDFGGRGRPLALLHHANGMCGAVWAPLARALATHYHVIAFDARGHGASQHLSVPDDYAWDFFCSDLLALAQHLLAQLGQERVALGLGSSFGGIVSAAAEARQPGTFERLVMLDPPIHPTPEVVAALGLTLPPWQDDRPGRVAQTLKRKAIWPGRAAANAAWRHKPLFAPWREAAFRLYLAYGLTDVGDGTVALSCPPEVEAHIFATTGSMDVQEYAPRVAAPVLFTRALRGFFPNELFERLPSLFPAGEGAALDAGHMLPLEAPDDVYELLRGWLNL